jgi:hypothetical protein
MSGRVPPSSRAKSRPRLNASKDVQKAARLYERFSGHEAESIGRVKVKPIPKVGVAIGDVDGILYTTVRDGNVEKYIHKFAHKDKPILVVSPDGKSLHLIGGAYTFTERGIVDMSDKKNRR